MSKFYEHITESVWADIHRRSNGTQERQEDNVNNLSIDGFFRYLIDNYRGIVKSFDKDHFCKNFNIDIVVHTNKDTIIYGSYIGEELSRLMVVFSNIGMVRLQKAMKRMKNLSSDVFTVSDYDDTYSNEPADDRFFITSKYGGTVSNSLFVKLINFLLDNKINESVWADIHRRSNGDQVRKEDEIPEDIKKALIEYAVLFAHKEAFRGNYRVGVCSEFEKFIIDFADTPRIVALNIDIDGLVDFVKKHWDIVCPFVIQVATDVKKDVDTAIDKLWDEVMKTNESVWADIHRRSNGEQARKEDEVLTDLEINSINEFVSMYCMYERSKYIQHHMVPLPPCNRKVNDYEGLIKYIEDRRKENLITNVGDYDKIIRYIKKNWEVLDMDKFIKTRIYSPDMMKYKKIVECEGVPGGATPANVGGMGTAYFPGPNGEPGSGDLPSPTGIVYQQVAPFGVFIKDLKKKKKKKKFRKEDEPCVHSPNAKVYDYVDDFREYVDRTYNNIDRK